MTDNGKGREGYLTSNPSSTKFCTNHLLNGRAWSKVSMKVTALNLVWGHFLYIFQNTIRFGSDFAQLGGFSKRK